MIMKSPLGVASLIAFIIISYDIPEVEDDE